MIDKDFIRTRTKLEKLVKKWKKLLWLHQWDIKVLYSRDDISSDSDRKSGLTCNGYCSAQWHYLNATITFNVQSLSTYSNYDMENVVIHELTHCVLDEVSGKRVTPSMERTTTMLALILQSLEARTKT